MNIIHHLVNEFMNIFHQTGYLGIVFASGIEYACVPAPPSEVIIPLVGAMAAKGEYNVILAYLLTVLGGVLGSISTYYIGYFGGTKLLKFIMKKIKKSEHIINKLNTWFSKHGKITVLVARITPFTRAYVSLIAGTERLNFKVFLIYSTIGIGIWNAILYLGGYFFGANIGIFMKMCEKYMYLICFFGAVLILTYIIVYFLRRKV